MVNNGTVRLKLNFQLQSSSEIMLESHADILH